MTSSGPPAEVSAPAVCVVVPTRNRAGYLEVALRSLQDQEDPGPHELVVINDGSTDATGEVARRAGVRCLRLDPPRGLNGARNAGVAASTAPLVVFVDDDVEAPPGWLRALVEGAANHPGAEAFGGPIRARLEGPAPRSCGRESPPITTLDLGDEDREADMVWGANFAVRRSAFERHGIFDEEVAGHGDEEDWLIGLHSAGGQIVYLAAAGLDHRRAGDDARLRSLTRVAFQRGRNARRTALRRGAAPSAGRELRDVAGAAWHTVRRRCPQGVIMGAHSAGRLTQSLLGR
ncbi:MAG: glycosyltransferase family A protein [Thermoleophilaceae bacterium]